MNNSSLPGGEYAKNLIRYKSRRNARNAALSRFDQDDLEQLLWIELISHWGQFDPGRASEKTFIARILDNKIVSIYRYTLAEMRTPRREEASLDEPILDGDGCSVLRSEVTLEVATDTGRYRDLERDMATVVARLPDELRLIALGLATGTPNSVGAELGISRRTMTKKVAELREIFHKAGLNQYL